MDEVRGLLARHPQTLPSLSSLGYRQIGDYLEGRCSLEQAVASIKTQTHRYARQQYAWFRLDDARIRWFDMGQSPEQVIEELVKDWLS